MSRGGGGRLDPDQLADLESQRDFLLASIRDLDREHEAGDLDDADHETLRDEYTARAAEVLRAIEEQREAFADARRDRSPGRTVVTFAVIIAVAVLAGFVLAKTIGTRGDGDSATGSVRTAESPTQRALGCQQLMVDDARAAIDCFEGVLVDDPRNVVASTWLAWQLELSNGEAGDPVVALRVEQLLADAVSFDPRYSQAKALRAIVATRHGDPFAAERFLDEFEASDPAPDAARLIEQFEIRARVDEIIETFPEPQRSVERCRAREDLADPSPALACWQGLLEEDPDLVDALIGMGWLVERTSWGTDGEVADELRERAADLLDRAIELEPDNATALLYRTLVSADRGDVGEARAFYDRLLDLDLTEQERALVERSGLDASIDALTEAPSTSGG